MTTKREALALISQYVTQDNARAILRDFVQAQPDDPETRAERLGRVCYETFFSSGKEWESEGMQSQWIAAAAAVEAECKPRGVDASMLVRWLQKYNHLEAAAKINRYVRGEDA